MSRVIAGLAAIDGAVVLDKRFALLGFGAEVSGELPRPRGSGAPSTPRASSASSTPSRTSARAIAAAYRFVQRHPRGLAIVISHDGGVSFVANRDGDVVSWQQSVSR